LIVAATILRCSCFLIALKRNVNEPRKFVIILKIVKNKMTEELEKSVSKFDVEAKNTDISHKN